MPSFKWTNKSVLGFAGDGDPVAAMERKARDIALGAIDKGWGGPPFDPLALAEYLEITTEAHGDIADARTIADSAGKLRLEYNPLRPRGRLRFSIAHEIAHTFFPDCAEAVRNRGGDKSLGHDDWQLEALCNIGAAELLMPSGSFTSLEGETLSIGNVLELRKNFDVSVEACLIRLVKLSAQPVAAFCASAHAADKYKIDYVIPAPGWDAPVTVGAALPDVTVIKEISAIGYTAVGDESWGKQVVLHIECVGLAPYPGEITPRVVGLLRPTAAIEFKAPTLRELQGDALEQRNRAGTTIVAHVVPDTSSVWGGGGFASQVRRRFPDVWKDYRLELAKSGPPQLGSTVVGKLPDDRLIVHMIAQHGIGPSTAQRLQYAALAECLGSLCDIARRNQASVQMPKIGTGHGGASWDIIKELIVGELVEKGVDTTVYQLPR